MEVDPSAGDGNESDGGEGRTGEGRTFDSDGFEIAFDDVGEGPPVVLVHGFASDRVTNWRRPGWYRSLGEAGRRVIALDCRGHGESEKSPDPDDYRRATMADDVVRLLDHLEIPVEDVVGYSMGSQVAARLLVDHPDRVNAVVLGGSGASVLEDPPNREVVAEALETDDPDDVAHPAGQRFRTFAERQGGDLPALAAAMRGFTEFDVGRLAEVTNPVLVVAGSEDRLVDDPGNLADLVPDAGAVTVPDRDHMTTVGDPRFRETVVDFLEREGLRAADRGGTAGAGPRTND